MGSRSRVRCIAASSQPSPGAADHGHRCCRLLLGERGTEHGGCRLHRTRRRCAPYKTALRATLREDPDAVLIGEMRDLGPVMQTGQAPGNVTLNDALMALVRGGMVTPAEAMTKAIDKPALGAMLAPR